jgi:hypothetical protein
VAGVLAVHKTRTVNELARSAISSDGNSRDVAPSFGINLFEERKFTAMLDLMAKFTF